MTVCATSLAYNCLFAPCTQVQVAGNLFRADCAKAFADVLKVNKTITDIDLSLNQIGAYAEEDEDGDDVWTPTPEGPAALAEGLKGNSTVTKVCVPSSSKMQLHGSNLIHIQHGIAIHLLLSLCNYIVYFVKLTNRILRDRRLNCSHGRMLDLGLPCHIGRRFFKQPWT